MIVRRFAGRAAIPLLLAAGYLMAKDFWEKPYIQWNKKEVDKMIYDSPWAKSQTIGYPTGGKGAGAGGEKELFSRVRVRLFSSLLVRQAYVRKLQILNDYDSRSESEKAEIDAKFSRVLKLDFSRQIMVALDFEATGQEEANRVRRYLENVKVDLLKQSCYLISDRLGRVTIEEYYPPSPDGSGAKFVFPRVVKDQPVVSPEDKEFKFDFWLEPIGQRMFITFKVKALMFNGELAI